MNDWTISGAEIRARGYGLLVNTRAGGSTGLLVTDFRISAEADSIELNTPQEALRNAVVWGGHLRQQGGAGSDAGFALGAAHVDGLVAGGFISHGSRLEGVHIEDGSRHVVLSAFVLRRCERDGIRLLPEGHHPQHYRPAVLTAFSVEGLGAPGTYGVFCVYDPTGFAGRVVAVGAYIAGFDAALCLDGPGLFAADQVSVENVDAVLELGDGARAPGSFFSKGARVFVRARGSGVAGRFHQEDRAPDKIIDRRGAGFCSVSGFSFPLKVDSRPAPAFPVAQHFAGRLTLIGRSGFWEAAVSADERSLSVVDARSAGTLTSVKLALEAGYLVIHGAPGGEVTLHFEGSYIA